MVSNANAVQTGRSAPNAPQTPGALTVWLGRLPGLVLCLAAGIAATVAARFLPLVGGPILAIVFGLLLKNLFTLPASLGSGIQFTGKKILQTGIVLLGGSFGLVQVWAAGVSSLAVMLSTLAVGVVGALFIGRALGIPWRITSLISVGTGICGASAIAAVAPVVDAEDSEVAYALSTVFFFNLVAVFLFPVLGHLMGLTTEPFAIWAGTAVNDTSSVVAAAYAFGEDAVALATVVKLARTVMIVPIAALFAFYVARQRAAGTQYSVMKIIPWFVVWFLVMAILNSQGVFPASVLPWLSTGGKFFITMALAAIGLGVNVRNLIKTGPRPLLLGACAWVLVAVTSLIVQQMTGLL